MNKKKTSLKDIAAAAGVSIMTVSRAIHGHPGTGPELQARIQALAEEMKYIPSRSVGALEMAGNSLTVGVVVPHFANTIFPEIIESIESFLSANGYRILLCCSYNNPVKEFREISSLLERKIDGIIWCPVIMDDSQNIAKMMRRQRCPFVFLDRIVEGVSADTVIVDDRDGMEHIVRHLLGQKLTRIAYLNARMDSYVARERLRGFREAHAQAGVPVREDWILNVGSDLAAGQSGTADLLNRAEWPEAICCFNDPLALGAELVLRERKIRIPHEIALTGFSGVVETELAAVPITSAYQNAAELGNAAARLLFSRMVNPDWNVTPVRKIIKTTLLLRESSLLGVNQIG